MTTITVEECKDTYVTSCTPPPTINLPECENGWEIGNGTAVCATSQPDALAATGMSFNDFGAIMLLGVALAIVIVGTGLAIWGRKRSE